jgi:S1-C subfamily serine protease
MRSCFAIFILSLPALSFAGPSVEEIFADAKGYTAYIETRIEVPFIEDKQSSFFGAGFVVNRDRRWLLTNAHVTGHSPAEITLSFNGGTRIDARPIYIDSYLDLAVLAFDDLDGVEPDEAQLDCRSQTSTGHPVGAFGHPKGLKFTGTRGIISGRTSKFGAEWLQTDATINAGNSGGPLISLQTSRVVGINTARLKGRNVQNTNFAMLSTHACRVLERLSNDQDPRPPDLGITFFEKEGEPTLRVAHVREKGRAAGFRRGDRIVAVAGQAVEPATEGELIHRLRGQFSGVAIEIERHGQVVSLYPTFEPQLSLTERWGVYVGGALFSRTNKADIEGLVTNPTVMVHYVAPGSAAQAAGVAKFDHLLAIDGQPVDSLDTLLNIIHAHPPDALASVELVRFITASNRFLADLLADIPLGSPTLIQFH